MTASFGNQPPAPPVGQEPAATATATPDLPAEPLAKKHYRKPTLKPLGLLRSVTGSNLTW